LLLATLGRGDEVIERRPGTDDTAAREARHRDRAARPRHDRIRRAGDEREAHDPLGLAAGSDVGAQARGDRDEALEHVARLAG